MTANMCTKLKWSRKQMGLSQRSFAEKVGLCAATISKLETDKSAWLTVRKSTEDKISEIYEQVISKQPDHNESRALLSELREVIETPDTVESGETVAREEVVDYKKLGNEDLDNLAIVNFITESLNEAMTHTEFVYNIKLLQKIVDKY